MILVLILVFHFCLADRYLKTHAVHVCTLCIHVLCMNLICTYSYCAPRVGIHRFMNTKLQECITDLYIQFLGPSPPSLQAALLALDLLFALLLLTTSLLAHDYIELFNAIIPVEPGQRSHNDWEKTGYRFLQYMFSFVRGTCSNPYHPPDSEDNKARKLFWSICKYVFNHFLRIYHLDTNLAYWYPMAIIWGIRSVLAQNLNLPKSPKPTRPFDCLTWVEGLLWHAFLAPAMRALRCWKASWDGSAWGCSNSGTI